jgi:hypothetical protein
MVTLDPLLILLASSSPFVAEGRQRPLPSPPLLPPPPPPPLPPLSGRLTRDGAALRLSGRAFAGVGVNIVDLCWNNNSHALRDAAERGVPFVRFAASPFFPDDLRAWRADPERYWRSGAGAGSGMAAGVDAAVQMASAARIRLVPDLLWNIFAFADLCHEPLGAFFNGTDSCARRSAAQYITQAVARYKSHPAILFWELSNENSALVDGWFANSTHDCVAGRGTPDRRTDADNFDTAQMVATHSWLAAAIRRHDPSRLISSGHGMPRPSAQHWRQTPRAEVARHHIDNTRDNRSEFERVLLDTNSPADFVSVHESDGSHDAGRLFVPSASRPTWLSELARSVANRQGKPLYLGEFSVHPAGVAGATSVAAGATAGGSVVGALGQPPARNYIFAEAVLDWLVECHRAEGGGGVLASVWVFEYLPQNKSWSVVPGRDATFLRKLQHTNHVLRGGG